MTSLLYVAGGGALGAVARYLLMVAIPSAVFPLGTLVVNVIGSFALGVLIEVSAIKYTMSYDMRLFLVVGVLGAFTTFSTFSLDAITLLERGDLKPAFIYIFLSVFGSLTAFFVGLWIMRKVFL
jgi:CrcB protein